MCAGTMELEAILAQVAAGQLAVSDAMALAQGPTAAGPVGYESVRALACIYMLQIIMNTHARHVHT